jgi:hypothetical protein
MLLYSFHIYCFFFQNSFCNTIAISLAIDVVVAFLHVAPISFHIVFSIPFLVIVVVFTQQFLNFGIQVVRKVFNI